MVRSNNIRRSWLCSLALLSFGLNGESIADEQKPLAPDCHFVFEKNTAEHSLRQYRNQVVLVDFWASWCGPCAQSFPFLNTLHQEFRDKGLQIIGVNLDEELSETEAFLAKNPPQFPIALNGNEQCAKDFAVQAMPSSYVIDKNGVIRLQKLGFRPSEAEQTRLLIEQLLTEK